MDMSNFRFGNPWLLFLMIPLIAGVVLGFFLMKKGKRYQKKNIISLCLHLVISVAIAFTFANPQFLTVSNRTSFYILADASASDKESISRTDQIIKKLKSEAEEFPNTKVGVVAFGKEAKVLTPLGGKFNSLADVYNDSTFNYTATDIKGALEFTSQLFDGDGVRRITLVSDGMETDNSALDGMEAVLAKDIQLDAIDVTANYKNEIIINALKYSSKVYLNREEKVEVSINSTNENFSKVNLYLNGNLKETKETSLSKGINIVSFDLDTSKNGEYKYKVEVVPNSPTNDTFIENNTRSFSQTVSDEFNILFVGSSEKEVSEFKRLGGFSDATKIDSILGDNKKVPTSLEELIKYDEIVVDNTDISSLNNYEQFISNLNKAVSIYGKSLMTFDSTKAGDTTSESVSQFNDLLPVQYQPDDTRALVLLIDTSGSMSGNNIQMAIAGAKAVVEKLKINDSISIVTFATDVQVPVSMTTLRNEQTRKEILDKINILSGNGSTDMRIGLEEAYKQIIGVSAEYKTVITISDGLPGDSESDLEKQVNSMSFNNISCSFINIGSGDGATLFKTLSKIGNGSYYYIDTELDLSKVMVDAIEQEVIDTVIEQSSSTIQYRLVNDPSLRDGLVDNLGTIDGFNYARMKSGANTVLTVQYVHTNSDNQINVIAIPLYAYWDFGKGRVTSFTSSLTGDWTRTLRNSVYGQLFFKNMISQSLPSQFARSILDVDYQTNGYTTTLKVSPNNGDLEAKISVKVTDPNNTVSNDINLVFDGTSYTTNLDTPNVGEYKVEITYSQKDSEGNYQVSQVDNVSIFYDFSKEFNFNDYNENKLLYKLSKQGSGNLYSENQALDDENKIYVVSNSQLNKASYTSTMVYFLAFTVTLFLADIAVRKTEFRRKKKEKKEEDNPASYF